MPRVSERAAFPFVPLRALRRAAIAIGALGAAYAVYETLVAFDVLPDGTALSPFDGREGLVIGLVMIAVSIAAIAGVLVAMRAPSLTATLLFVAACAGFLAVGAPWIGPGVLLAAASWLALLSIPNPFREEIERERLEGQDEAAAGAERATA
jgi:hypothetical protein